MAHLPEGELVRYLDGELEATEREPLLAHLAECGACSERLDTLRMQSQAVSELIARLPAPALSDIRRARMRAALAEAERRTASHQAPPRRWMLRVAASVAVAFTAALAVEPVRAWIIEQWDYLSPRTEVAVQTPVVESAAAIEEGSRITFAPVGEVFRLELAHPQRTGTVTLQMGESEVASAQVVGGTGSILVLPDGIRIANPQDSSADYLVTLPAHLASVRLQVGEGRPVTLRPLPGTLVYDLGRGEVLR